MRQKVEISTDQADMKSKLSELEKRIEKLERIILPMRPLQVEPATNSFLYHKCCENCKYCIKQPIKTSAVEYSCNYPKHEGETFLFDSCPDYVHNEIPKGVYTFTSSGDDCE